MKGLSQLVFLLTIVFCSNALFGQKVKVNLIAKMDISKQYNLDFRAQEKTMLMGFTYLFGAPIRLPSPTLTFTEGDSVEIHLRNMSQSAPHTIHLHGLDVDQVTDGVPSLSFSIPHDSTGVYKFVAPHPGTYLYHCHVISTLHVQAGMYGVIIVKPKTENMTWEGGYSYTNEKTFMMSELDTNWHSSEVIHMPGQHDPKASVLIPDYNPQHFYINGSNYYHPTGEDELNIEGFSWQQTYLRLVNIGYYGNRFIVPKEVKVRVISSDGRPLPEAEEFDTLEIYPGERYGVLFNFLKGGTSPIVMEYFDLNTREVKGVVKSIYRGLSDLNDFQNQIIEVYPNPGNDKITLSCKVPINEELWVEVLDLSGRKLQQNVFPSASQSKYVIPTKDLENGMYFFRVRTKFGLQVKRVQVQH